MKKILFDFISVQGSINGGAEYTKRILEELHLRKKAQLYALFDSRVPFMGNDREKFSDYFHKWIDINGLDDIGDYCESASIDLFFIGIFQRYLDKDLSGIKCKVVAVIHDILDIECKATGLFFAFNPKYALKLLFRKSQAGQFKQQGSFLLSENVELVSVSKYSAGSIKKYLPFLAEKEIKVLYSPLRNACPEKIYPMLEGKKYFLLLRAHMPNKNAALAFKAMRIFHKKHPDYLLATTGPVKQIDTWHLPLPWLEAGELEYALAHAAALIYPSFVEGFGYPPVEAMRHGTPVLSSNTTSLPEIIADGGLFFSPFSARELANRMEELINGDAALYADKAKKRFNDIARRQENDLEELINILLRK